MNNIIFLFGASCSGKSTLGIALQNSLGRDWTYIDRDDLIESGECTEEAADAALDQRIQRCKTFAIVDSQIPWREKRTGEWYFLIRPPLTALLERDAKRTLLLKREEKRAARAKAYVIETHQMLEKLEKSQFDDTFDTSKMSIDEEIQLIRNKIFPSIRLKP